MWRYFAINSHSSASSYFILCEQRVQTYWEPSRIISDMTATFRPREQHNITLKLILKALLQIFRPTNVCSAFRSSHIASNNLPSKHSEANALQCTTCKQLQKCKRPILWENEEPKIPNDSRRFTVKIPICISVRSPSICLAFQSTAVCQFFCKIKQLTPQLYLFTMTVPSKRNKLPISWTWGRDLLGLRHSHLTCWRRSAFLE